MPTDATKARFQQLFKRLPIADDLFFALFDEARELQMQLDLLKSQIKSEKALRDQLHGFSVALETKS